jgi:hypothetical protein
MGKIFEIIFLEEAFSFLSELDKKHYEKILYNIRKAQNELLKAKQLRTKYFKEKEKQLKKKKK